MKYTLFIFLFFSINLHAQKPTRIYRIIEKTNLNFDELSETFNFDTVPIPMKSLNAKIIFNADQILIIDDDTTFITLGPESPTKKDSNSVSYGWPEADHNGVACNVFLYTYPDEDYDKVVVFYEDDNLGYFYMLSALKPGVIPTASTVPVFSKKKSK